MLMHQIEEILEYSFKDKKLLTQALTHKSFAAEHKCANYNERLEFLGDSVLGLVVAHYVFNVGNTLEEGKLAKLKSHLVSRDFLAHWAKDIELGKSLFLGQGEHASGGRNRDSILSDAMEAVIGAAYLDGGFKIVKQFIDKRLSLIGIGISSEDFKSELQEIIQKKLKTPPIYEVVQTIGPEHDKTFTVTVNAKNIEIGKGKGKNKKEAEQYAAKDALNNIKDGKTKI